MTGILVQTWSKQEVTVIIVVATFLPSFKLVLIEPEADSDGAEVADGIPDADEVIEADEETEPERVTEFDGIAAPDFERDSELETMELEVDTVEKTDDCEFESVVVEAIEDVLD